MSANAGGDAMYATIGKHIISLAIPILVGIGSAAITTTITIARLEERVVALERKTDTHGAFSEGLRTKDDDFERRVTRLETLLENLNSRMADVGGDVKILLQRVGK